MSKVTLKEKKASLPPTSPSPLQFSFLSSIVLLIPFILLTGYISSTLHYTLPIPSNTSYSSDGLTPKFNEQTAMNIISDLSTHPDGTPKYRIVGTEEMVETDKYVLKKAERIKEEVGLNMGELHQIEIWHQVGSGSHLFDFMNKKVWKQYTNITNVIVRLSNGTPEGKANAVLVNAHTDSTLPSPGAADDLVGVATMLEALRVMAMSPRRLTNSVVFLFNGAEESLQDASHCRSLDSLDNMKSPTHNSASAVFITQHSIRKTIRSVINLEACGVGGPEIVFQATSEEMIHALAKTPRPYGTVLATEVFSSGLIILLNMETSLYTTILVTKRNLALTNFTSVYRDSTWPSCKTATSTTLASVRSSPPLQLLFSHPLSPPDLPEYIEPGALTHMGENTLALLTYLTSNETILGKSGKPLPLAKTADTIFFSALGGKIFVVYSRAQATIIYGVLSAMTAIVVMDRVDWKRRKVYVAALVGVSASFVGALLAANLAAFVTGYVMNKSLTWCVPLSLLLLLHPVGNPDPRAHPSRTRFRHEAFPVLLYSPPAFLGAILAQRIISNFVRTAYASPEVDKAESALLEHAALVGQTIHYSALTVLGHACGLGSSYLFVLSGGSALITLVVNDYVLKRGKRGVSLGAYFLGQLSPLLLGVEGLVGLLDLFVPLTGRMGADAPADLIIATLTTGIGFLAVPMILPFCHRFGAVTTSRMALALTFITAGTMGWFTRPSWTVFDREHPKRLLVLHMENQTSTEVHLHIASIDGTPSYDLIQSATQSLSAGNAVPVNVEASDSNADWIVLFPVDSFLTNYKVPLPPLPSSYVSPWEGFQVVAENSVLNSIKQTRSLDIVMKHPGIIWPVVAFTADVVDWKLPEAAPRGVVRHHVKSVSGWGVERFVVSLVIKLSPAEFEAAVRENQRAKGQRGDVSEEDRKLATLRIDYSGLDRNGMYPASSRHEKVEGAKAKPGMVFFREFEKGIPDYVDAMLLSAVAGVASV
ncbi:hypothetical protein P7C70_g5142, partial [Phenoliferia sp. Uapishka_3]